MRRTFLEREASDNPVRFVLTTGDNIYADRHWFGLPTGSTATEANPAEISPSYLDNFFFPAPQPSRYYSFSFGGLAEFFALDSTGIPAEDGQPIDAPRGHQFQWLEQVLPSAKAPWKIPYFHDPPFNAGPRHAPSLKRLQSFVDLFGRSGVKAVFNGHEHNFQWSERNDAGARGALRNKRRGRATASGGRPGQDAVRRHRRLGARAPFSAG